MYLFAERAGDDTSAGMQFTLLVDESGSFENDREAAVVGAVLVPTATLVALADAMQAAVARFDPGAPFLLHAASLHSRASTLLSRVFAGGLADLDGRTRTAVERLYRRMLDRQPALVAAVEAELWSGGWPSLATGGACRQLDDTLRRENRERRLGTDFHALESYCDQLESAPIAAAGSVLAATSHGALPVVAASESELGNWRASPLPEHSERYLTLLSLVVERALDVVRARGGGVVDVSVCSRNVFFRRLKPAHLVAIRRVPRVAHALAGSSVKAELGRMEVMDYPRPDRRMSEPELRPLLLLYLADAAANRARSSLTHRGREPLSRVVELIHAGIPGASVATQRTDGEPRSHLAATAPARTRVLTGGWPAQGAPAMFPWAFAQATSW